MSGRQWKRQWPDESGQRLEGEPRLRRVGECWDERIEMSLELEAVDWIQSGKWQIYQQIEAKKADQTLKSLTDSGNFLLKSRWDQIDKRVGKGEKAMWR